MRSKSGGRILPRALALILVGAIALAPISGCSSAQTTGETDEWGSPIPPPYKQPNALEQFGKSVLLIVAAPIWFAMMFYAYTYGSEPSAAQMACHAESRDALKALASTQWNRDCECRVVPLPPEKVTSDDKMILTAAEDPDGSSYEVQCRNDRVVIYAHKWGHADASPECKRTMHRTCDPLIVHRYDM